MLFELELCSSFVMRVLFVFAPLFVKFEKEGRVLFFELKEKTE